MKKVIVILAVIILLAFCIYFAANYLGKEEEETEADKETTEQDEGDSIPSNGTVEEMNLASSAFSHEAKLPVKYTCDGDGVNPELLMSNIPDGTVSLALILNDPDAPSGDFVHWLLWNIDPKTTNIKENSTPNGAAVGVNSFGDNAYGPPCPPSGSHRYTFKLYALDIGLGISSSSEKGDLTGAMEGHVLGTTELVGLYK